MESWEKVGKPIPVVHAMKQQMITSYGKKHNIDTLIETGTYLGDMVWAQRKNFTQIYSIELSEELAQKAQKRFKSYPYIHIVQGDSGKKLFELQDAYQTPALFWLDGHYSGGITAQGDKDCPIYGELGAIFQTNKNHVLLIDDAREFVGKGDYPSLEELSGFILKIYPNSIIHVENDIIVVELQK